MSLLRRYDTDRLMPPSESATLASVLGRGTILGINDGGSGFDRASATTVLSDHQGSSFSRSSYPRPSQSFGEVPPIRVHFETLATRFGHDAFLVNRPREAALLNTRLNAFLGASEGEGVDKVRRLVRDETEA